MIKVLYINTCDLRNETQEYETVDDLKRFIAQETEEWTGIDREEEDWTPMVVEVNKAEFEGSKDVYFEKGFGNHHIWVIQ